MGHYIVLAIIVGVVCIIGAAWQTKTQSDLRKAIRKIQEQNQAEIEEIKILRKVLWEGFAELKKLPPEVFKGNIDAYISDMKKSVTCIDVLLQTLEKKNCEFKLKSVTHVQTELKNQKPKAILSLRIQLVHLWLKFNNVIRISLDYDD